MARSELLLTAKGVAGDLEHGRHFDGGGLMLVVDQAGRRWVYRYMRGGRRREMGLGSYPTVTLARARQLRDKWRDVLLDGRDPIDARAVENAPKGRTFGEAADAYYVAHSGSWRHSETARQWRASLTVHCKSLRARPVESVKTADVLAVVSAVHARAPHTALRTRMRIEMVLDFARAHGWIDPDAANPARGHGHLALLLPKSPTVKGHFASLPYDQVPALVARLREIDKVTARALEFCILCASRAGEIRGAVWDEIDLDKSEWRIPAARMKAAREHAVPLVARCVEILREVREAYPKAKHCFPGLHGRAMADGSTQVLLRSLGYAGMTVHGLRATFRTWAAEKTSFARELCEVALAHAVGDQTERSYQRGEMLERRRALMQAWADYIAGGRGAEVLQFPGGGQAAAG